MNRELRPAEVEGEQMGPFLEGPLTVGGAIMHAEPDEEVSELLREAKVVAERFGREPGKVLVIETAPREVSRAIRRRAASNRYRVGSREGSQLGSGLAADPD